MCAEHRIYLLTKNSVLIVAVRVYAGMFMCEKKITISPHIGFKKRNSLASLFANKANHYMKVERIMKLYYYTLKSIATFSPNTKEINLIFSNRSAVLFRLKR